MSRLVAVLPPGVRDPARPSGGNHYDVRVLDELRRAGWSVTEIEAPGSWPTPGAAALRELGERVAAVPDAEVVLVDGLVASAAPEALVPAAARLRLAVLVHQPLCVAAPGDAEVARREAAVLLAAERVVVTSRWCRAVLLERYAVAPGRVTVALPGTDPAPLALPSATGGRLLTVGAVTPGKGMDLVLEAAARLPDHGWTWQVVGPLDRDPGFAERMVAAAGARGGRLVFTGALAPDALARAYARSDLLVHPSRAETYGMVLTEALARGLPVVAARTGGVAEAVGSVDGRVPGALVPPGDAEAVAAAVGSWLGDSARRREWRELALARRERLEGWAATAAAVGAALGSGRALQPAGGRSP